MVSNTKVLWFLSSKKLGLNIFSIIRRFSSDNGVIIQEINDKGILIFNRPKVHNAINSVMMANFYGALRKFENDKKKLLIVKGSGGRAYCAGGDLKALTKDGRNDGGEKHELLKYSNACILWMSARKIPIVALVHGITLGGGVGLAVFGKYQVATENTLLGMPESKIGFHPNCGASYFFTRLNGRLGWYLGLTGQNINGADAVRISLVSHYCHSSKLPALENQLLKCANETEVANTLDEFCESDIPEFSLGHAKNTIDRCFSAYSVEEILSRLTEDGSTWSKNTIETLTKLSPTSLKVILKQLNKAKEMTLRECLIMEYNLTNNFWKSDETHEGRRLVQYCHGSI
nr:3-hydroxyisobutyryl-CoA hydrolase, mitochondrial-like [Leptinotarsa decemlineata]